MRNYEDLDHGLTSIFYYLYFFFRIDFFTSFQVLLRCRAVENQCYVIAAAQTGQHNAKRRSYGHAMVCKVL